MPLLLLILLNSQLINASKVKNTIDTSLNSNDDVSYIELCDISAPSLGMGYDFIVGNPLGNTESHSDVGYKLPILSIPIKEWDYNQFLPTTFQIESLFSKKCRLEGIWIRKSTTCEQRKLPSFMKTTDSLNLNETNNTDSLSNKKVVQIAIKNNTLKKTVKNTSFTNVDRVICSIYQAGLIVPNEWNFSNEFKEEIKHLPVDFKDEELKNCTIKEYLANPESAECIKNVKPWINMFRKFGGQIVNMESYTDVTDSSVGKNLENSEIESINKSNYKNVVVTKKSTSDQWSIGGVPKGKIFSGNLKNKKREYSRWARSVYEKPMPIQCGLDEIFEISSNLTLKKYKIPYKVALKYYNEIYGLPSKNSEMEEGIFTSFDKVMSEMDMIMQKGKYPFAHCKNDEEVVAGFSLIERDDGIEIEECETGRDGCLGKGESTNSFTFIFCSKTANNSIASMINNTEEAKCQENYTVGLGYIFGQNDDKSIEITACKIGERRCGARNKSAWIMCVHRSIQGVKSLSKFDNLLKEMKGE